MKVPKKPLIVFFVDGLVATPDEIIASQQYSVGKVRMQNARLVTEVDPGVDGVAGTIPPAYKGYKTAEEALVEYGKALEAIRKASKDSVAPTPKTKASEREDFETKDEEPEEAEPAKEEPVKKTPTKSTKQPTVKPKAKS